MTESIPLSVCILTAGTGRRSGPFADIINKCLLPYKGRAIISHIIDHFTVDTPFVIALGYKADQVRSYLTLMHPERVFTFVEVDRYTGPQTGPGYSLSCCKKMLKGAFYFIAGDGVFEHIPSITDKNWLGISRPESEKQDLSSYCNIAYNPNTKQALKVYDKTQPPAEQGLLAGIFTGLMFIKDADVFWNGLEKSTPTTNEIQIAQGFSPLIQGGTLYCESVEWRDLGTFELYKNALSDAFDFSKTEEFIYLSDTRVVKFFVNSAIVEQRVRKTEYLPNVFPKITGVNNQFYAYEKVKGKTAYEMLDERLVGKLLVWLKQSFWTRHETTPERMEALCQSFYHEKTYQRVAAYKKKYPQVPEATSVNGKPVMPVAALLAKLPSSLVQGVPVFMHGDLQFDNIITDGEHFTLIDWRQDFAGEIAYGDWYYDLAKLLGGIHLNYDYIKHGLMHFDQQGESVWIDYAVRQQAPAYAKQLQDFVEAEGLDFTRVEILRGMIYLNMAPLHHPPFDRLLYALAQVTLTKALA
jgi:NDP-sugar pyrophosphorylase family protein